MRAVLVLALMTVFVSPASAEGPGYQAEGVFQGSGEGTLRLQIVVMETPVESPDTYAATVNTSTGTCIGSVSLRGLAVSKQRLEFRRKETLDSEECVVTATFDGTFKSVRITEFGCGSYHGASCAFNGALKRLY